MTATSTLAWDGLVARDVGARLGLSNVWIYSEVESTQDIAHELAEQGAPAGTLVVADAQRSGRGRHGRTWTSQPGQGVWCTIVERPVDPGAIEVLSLRIGIRLAAALDQFAGRRVQLKWPNDLVLPDTVIPSREPERGARGQTSDLHFAKLGGILTEARWSGSSLAWVAVGVGVNVTRPEVSGAAWLPAGSARLDVLRAVVSAVRQAAASRGPLTSAEIASFDERDALAGRRIVSPGIGSVEGIDPTGALLVRHDGGVRAYRSGTVQPEVGS